jgi:hypothetical protein
MIPHIPHQRQNKSNTSKPFNDLIEYIEEDKGQEKLKPQEIEFEKILNYASASHDKTGEEKCIAVRTHGVSSLENASAEMNAVSVKNTRCKDPAFHFILSWPEHEKPEPNLIFDAAEHAIEALGLAQHQYVIAIHGNTDNMHCHVAVNRVHPDTHKSRHIEWAQKTLHKAARESEIKHGWAHDRGIYIVNTLDSGEKKIELSDEHGKAVKDALPYVHRELDQEEVLPPWHDPESLETWLKTDVQKVLKRALPKLKDWNALHGWLAKYGIQLTDTGGGGMRLYATAEETGEVLDMPASKGLRLLKRAELEERWGKFRSGAIEPDPDIPSYPADSDDDFEVTTSVVPDLSHLTKKQLMKGVNHVLRQSPDGGIPPNASNLFLHAESDRRIPPTHRRGSLYELPVRGLDGHRQGSEMLLPDVIHVHVGDERTRQDPDLRWTRDGTTRSRRSLNRNNELREIRKDQRAAARADLRSRFSQYKRFVRENDIDHWAKLKDIKAIRSEELKNIRTETKNARLDVRKNKDFKSADRLNIHIAIDLESSRRKLKAETDYQVKVNAINATRVPPLGWREWLYEQSNLGDQAALSALRGIVYQAQRDAKKAQDESTALEIKEAFTAADKEMRFKQLMARLVEEEKKEMAIRAASIDAMRPYEADALLRKYLGLQWKVTGNGNIEYSDRDSMHMFTDRGNRITFDKVIVTDDEIKVALEHARNKFGRELTLTGNDPVFTARMARIADDMGIAILNSEMQNIIAQHRESRIMKGVQLQQESVLPEEIKIEPDTDIAITTTSQDLQSKILAINPRAKFIVPNTEDRSQVYLGPIVGLSDSADQKEFVQHIGRGVYVIHQFESPENSLGKTFEIQYIENIPALKSVTNTKNKEK